MLCGLNWSNRRKSVGYINKQYRESLILWLSGLSIPISVRVWLADAVHYVLDFLNFRLLARLTIVDTHRILNGAFSSETTSASIIFCMNHPGIDERLLVQYISRTYFCRKAYAVTNLINIRSGQRLSPSFMKLMHLEGVVTSRGVKAMSPSVAEGADSHTDTSAQEEFFVRTGRVLSSGSAHLIYAPEGETNPWPRLKKCKTGAARSALMAVLQQQEQGREIWLLPVVTSFRARGLRFRDACFEIGRPIKLSSDTISIGYDQNMATGASSSQFASELINSRAGFACVQKITGDLQLSMGELANIIRSDSSAPLHQGDQVAEASNKQLLWELNATSLLSSLAAAMILIGHVEGLSDVSLYDEPTWNDWPARVNLTRALGQLVTTDETNILNALGSFQKGIDDLKNLISSCDIGDIDETRPYRFRAIMHDIFGLFGFNAQVSEKQLFEDNPIDWCLKHLPMSEVFTRLNRNYRQKVIEFEGTPNNYENLIEKFRAIITETKSLMISLDKPFISDLLSQI